MISFGHPAFLLGLLSIGIPIYLHLYFRKNPVPRDFPSLRLIRLSMQAMVRRMRLKNLLLLLLRILAIFFLTLAFSKPFWNASGSGSASNGEPSAFVIVLDNSLSMGASHQGISLFHSAKAKALEIVERMGPSDKASIALLNDPGSLLFPQLTWDKNELKEAIRNVPLSNSGTNLFSSLQPALKLLVQVRSFKRSLYLITDMTAGPWKKFLDAYDPKGIDKEIDLVLVPVGNGEPPNLTLADLSLGAPTILRERPVPIQVVVANSSKLPQKARLSLIIDGDKKHEQAIELDAQQTSRFTFSCTFPKEGVSHIRASLSGDSLPLDDTRHLAAKVLAPQKVLIVKPPPDRQGRETREDLFLKFALNPMSRLEKAPFAVESRYLEELSQIKTADYAMIILVNQRSLPDEVVNKIGPWVLQGGNLLIFMGSRVDPTWYNFHLIDQLGGNYLLPAHLQKRTGNAVSKTISYQLTDLDSGHPAFKLFSLDGNGDPGKAHFYEYYQMEANPSALILARMSHGFPAIAEEKRGQGTVVLFSFTADTEWTNWPLKPTFLPFLHQLAFGMIGKQGLAGETFLPGSLVSLFLPDQGVKRVTLTLPKGNQLELPINKERAGFANISTTETDETGFYRLSVEKNGSPLQEAFAVNFPAEEGNLERIDPLKIPRFILISQQPGGKQSLGEKIVAVREGRELAMSLLWALLVTACLETFLANVPLSRSSNA